MMKKILVAMSGGVDSSVSAALLQEQGYEVCGVFMKGWSDPTFLTGHTLCPWEEDQEEARKAAAILHIPFYTWDVEDAYKAKVVDYMITAYRSGITPNPDVMCNKEIKCTLFLQRALALGFDMIATGHYVRTSVGDTKDKEGIQLLAGKDVQKDQSYFLWTLTQAQLRHILFPVGDFVKPHVRALAEQFHLLNAQRKDSQGVCFVGQLKVFDFLKSKIGVQKGPVMTRDGVKKGEHDGVCFYTIGQRHHLYVPGGAEVYYVVEKDIARNILYVGIGKEDPLLYKKELCVTQAHWISGERPLFPLSCHARIRYRQKCAPCEVRVEEGHNDRYRVVFVDAQRAVTPGQSIVFYEGDVVLGGGVIN